MHSLTHLHFVNRRNDQPINWPTNQPIVNKPAIYQQTKRTASMTIQYNTKDRQIVCWSITLIWCKFVTQHSNHNGHKHLSFVWFLFVFSLRSYKEFRSRESFLVYWRNKSKQSQQQQQQQHEKEKEEEKDEKLYESIKR